MTSLYNIGEDLLQQIEQIQGMIDEGAAPSSNEIQERLQEMVGTEDTWRGKAINVAHYVRHLEAQEAIIKEEIKRLQDKAKTYSKRSDYLRQILMQQMTMFGVDKIESAVLSLRLQNNPWSVVVDNEEALPEQYKRTKTIFEVDKKALLTERPELDGVGYVQTKRLVFK